MPLNRQNLRSVYLNLPDLGEYAEEPITVPKHKLGTFLKYYLPQIQFVKDNYMRSQITDSVTKETVF
jgi:hypothetical protein